MFNLFTLLFTIVFGVLSIVLFFKLWQMCNDVKKITYFIESRTKQPTEHPLDVKEATEETFHVGQLVVVKADESQFRIDEIDSDGYYSKKLNRHFSGDEIEDFEAYWNNKK